MGAEIEGEFLLVAFDFRPESAVFGFIFKRSRMPGAAFFVHAVASIPNLIF